ncbi:MAG TPA: class I SAM-dependent methyltransferase, partial [Puia sp.]
MFTNQLGVSFSGSDFENIYMASRKKENRVYSDEQVEHLPFIGPTHIHYDEWQARKKSSARLKNYLENKNKPLSILEVGCGNGWLSARLAALKDSEVTGTDIDKTELSQAKRVFCKLINIHFETGDIKNIQFDKKFDIIVFAASIQYFPSFDRVVSHALSLLNQEGEIHILDSHIYHLNEIEPAKKRSQTYYHSIGFGGMAEFYFHHS